jgi:hypothetical protein
MHVIYFMHIDLSKHLRLTIGSNLTLIQNEFWVPKSCHAHSKLFFSYVRVSKKCHQEFTLLRTYYICYIHHFFGWKVMKNGSPIMCFHPRKIIVRWFFLLLLPVLWGDYTQNSTMLNCHSFKQTFKDSVYYLLFTTLCPFGTKESIRWKVDNGGQIILWYWQHATNLARATMFVVCMSSTRVLMWVRGRVEQKYSLTFYVFGQTRSKCSSSSTFPKS